jgi:hypothetical protein
LPREETTHNKNEVYGGMPHFIVAMPPTIKKIRVV